MNPKYLKTLKNSDFLKYINGDYDEYYDVHVPVLTPEEEAEKIFNDIKNNKALLIALEKRIRKEKLKKLDKK